MTMKIPRDRNPYKRDPRSAPISATTPDGEHGVVWVLPDEGHVHAKVLGGARPALYAGDLTIERGKIKDVTNLSGTFRFSSRRGLRNIAKQLRSTGLKIMRGGVRFFPKDGSRPEILE